MRKFFYMAGSSQQHVEKWKELLSTRKKMFVKREKLGEKA